MSTTISDTVVTAFLTELGEEEEELARAEGEVKRLEGIVDHRTRRVVAMRKAVQLVKENARDADAGL